MVEVSALTYRDGVFDRFIAVWHRAFRLIPGGRQLVPHNRMALFYAQGGKEEGGAGCGAVRSDQPMPGGQEFRVCFGQSLALVVEDFQGQAGVEFRVVDLPPVNWPSRQCLTRWR